MRNRIKGSIQTLVYYHAQATNNEIEIKRKGRVRAKGCHAVDHGIRLFRFKSRHIQGKMGKMGKMGKINKIHKIHGIDPMGYKSCRLRTIKKKCWMGIMGFDWRMKIGG